MANQNLQNHPLSDRVETLKAKVDAALGNSTGAAARLEPELRSLLDGWARAHRWLRRMDAKVPRSVERLLGRNEAAVTEATRVPSSGPDAELKLAAARASLASATTQLLLYAFIAVEQDELQVAGMSAAHEAMLAENQKEHLAAMAQVAATLETAKVAAATAAESAKKVGITVHMTAFATAASANAREAKGWAVAAAGAAAFLMVASACAIAYGDGPPIRDGSWAVAANLSHYSSRALIITLASFLVVFSTRNYRAAKHNQVINLHRSSALATRETLATPDAGSRVHELVDLQVAEAVFAPQSTGYGAPEAPGTHLTELLSAIKGGRS